MNFGIWLQRLIQLVRVSVEWHSLPCAGAAATLDTVVSSEDVASIWDKKVAVNGCVANRRTTSCIDMQIIRV